MRGRTLALAALCIAALAATTLAAAGDFTAHLAGRNEVPPVDTRAQGQVKVSFDDAGTTGAFRLITANIQNVTQAHIHCGPPGANGPVVLFLFGFVTGGVNVNGILAQGTFTGSNIIPRAPSAVCPGGVGDLAGLIAQVQAGNAYVNVHTVQNPGGEVRGQLQPAE